ncbi:MAG: exosortase/archaeosortase family protein [candidate division Zixibacteria bacterium]|nr:exosortase/archaeosortase family protein [candidate division Zixibacteria bacterium]
MKIEKQKIKEHLVRFKFTYILLFTVILFNLSVFKVLISDWYHDDNYSHGFLIIPISIYLLFNARTKFVFPAQPSKLGLLFLIPGCIGYLLGIAASEYFTTRFSLVLILTGIGLYSLGLENFRKAWFPFFFLLFMIPIPAVIYYSATAPMQLLASKATNSFLQILGVPSIRQGNIINLPDYRLEVAEACSGLRSLVTLLALSSLYAYWKIDGKIKSVILFIATFPIAIAANIFRVMVTALGAYAISKSVADSFLHELSGTIVFMIALIMIFILGAILQWTKNRS